MSLTIEIRSAGGGTSTTVSSVGQVVNLEILAVVTDPNNEPQDDGVQDVTGSILSSAVDGHAVAGSLAAANLAPFAAFGSYPGAQQPLTSDGNIDVGSNSAVYSTDYFEARSSPIQTGSSGTGTISGNDLTFEIGTLTYTVTSLNKGGTTDINFRPFQDTLADGAAWAEDIGTGPTNGQKDNLNGTYQAGTPFVVSDPSLIVAPTAVNYSAAVVKNTPTDINELSVDDIVAPLNPASVTIVQGALHGTTALQSNGEILYTPATNYTGTDSFTYHVSDTSSPALVSNTATVTITVTNSPPPTAGAVTATAVRNNPVTISVLSHDSSVATLVPSSVTVVGEPSDGTAVAQSSGTIIYTPEAGFTGTDTFTYTVSDSNDETSTPGTVTVNVVTPVPPVATNATYNTTAGAPVTLDVLSVDTYTTAPLNPASVTITTEPGEGTAVPQSDGEILYTPTAGYVGTDSFVYTVDDEDGDVSNHATVTIDIGAALPPVATGVVAPVLSGSGSSTINVISSITTAAPIIPSSVTVVTKPTDGSATVNTSTGNISYTPVAGFIGTDTFTYTAENTNDQTTAPATVTVNVGTTISSAKGATHSVTFTDATGGAETLSLNVGSAQIFFAGTGSLTTSGSKATVSGADLSVGSITLTGTTAGSSLVIKGSTKTPTTLGGITDTAPLGTLSAASANITGNITLDSAKSITLGSISNATISIGAAAPGKTTLTFGAVTNTALTSAVPITALKAASWANSPTSTQITAPSIGSLTITGAFEAALALTGTGKTIDLKSAKIGGAVDGSLTGGNVGSFTAGSINNSWVGNLTGALTALTVKSGGFGSSLHAGAVGSLTFTGNLIGSITATSIKALRVTGAVSGSNIDTTGSIGSITAGSFTGSTIDAGTTTAFANVTASNLGGATISSIKSGSFASTAIVADQVGSASLGTITTGNDGTAFGIAAGKISGFTGVFATGTLRASRNLLGTEVLFQSYVTQSGAQLGDFNVDILG
jgi:hypothetical protein